MNKIILRIVLIVPFIFSAFCAIDNESWEIRKKAVLQSKEFWVNDAQEALLEKTQYTLNQNVAKNIIYFIGDGMSTSTVTASRIYDGQLKGIIGERNRLAFEKFPHVGLSKTYCLDKQIADSACSATAYLCGIKANFKTLGVTPNVAFDDCKAALEPENQIESIGAWAQNANKSTGIVTTTRITHASPAGVYAHSANRHHECDGDIDAEKALDENCLDHARQLIQSPVGNNLTVILGGGQIKFLPNTTKDIEGNDGERLDGRNLIEEWLDTKNGTGEYVSNRQQLLNLDINTKDNVLGLFASGHMPYHLDAAKNIPTLAEMTEVAIKMLSKNEKGYFLFVEGGRIDHGHHDTKARKALDEATQLSIAIEKAIELTNDQDTLIVVTADHGHTLTISGYADLGNNIGGLSTTKSDIDNLPYTTLNYANGPYASKFFEANPDKTVKRVDLGKMADLGKKDFIYPHMIPMAMETHEGGDVAIYANGPWSHLFGGVNEQNTLPSLMGYAACIGPGLKACDKKNNKATTAPKDVPYFRGNKLGMLLSPGH